MAGLVPNWKKTAAVVDRQIGGVCLLCPQSKIRRKQAAGITFEMVAVTDRQGRVSRDADAGSRER